MHQIWMIRAGDSLSTISAHFHFITHVLSLTTSSPTQHIQKARQGCSRVGQQGGWTFTNHSFLSHATQHLLINAERSQLSHAENSSWRREDGSKVNDFSSDPLACFKERRIIRNIWILEDKSEREEAG